MALVAKNQCIDTAVIKPVMLSPNLINAFFTALPTTGCEPLSVTLQDLSTGAVGLSWCFDFDQTTNACIGGSAVNIAGAGFQQTFAAGIHTIALYATNGYGCARDTAFQTINVSPAPVADFVSASGLCAEVPVAFTDQTIAPSGSFVSAYRWQFGDGDSAIIRDPVHTYPTVGNYSVCLEVVSAFGCYDSICKEVVILSKPEVGFSSFDTCLNTPPIAFTNLSNGATFYDWSFGDGNTSALPSPVHSYSNSGTFTVQLIGFTQSCSDTAQHNVTIYPVPKPSFNLPSVYSCGVPSSIVLNNTTTGANNFAWDFDNNATSTLTNPIAIYSSSGQYNITLTASNSFGCFDTAKRLIDIYPFPDIHSVEVQPSSGCDPVNALFTVNASNANQFVWDFSDGSSFTTLSSTISHRFDGPGYYSVLLKVYSFNDCGDTLFMQDTVHVYVIPTARFGYAMNDNVEPYNGTVVFTNQSENASNYFWDFGDGSNSNVTSPSHIFPSVNQFEVMLISSSAYGCSDTMIKRIDIIKKSLFVPNILAPDFSAGNDMIRRWKLVGSGLKEYRAQIFNQWGELLWESSAIDADFNVAEGWDGTYRGQICQQDVYVWKIEAVFLDGTRWEGMNYEKGAPRKTIGTVTLVR
ncbi:MAG: PKD domain-containing protein [Bacteroidetes bacterium]|nr:PKD domain-containing protein [Bacteroidota bacterium]